MGRIVPAVVTVLAALLIAGCVTPIDWNARVGVYSYNQAVMDFGSPLAMTRLNDGSTVADWMTERGSVVVTPGPYYYGAGPYYRGGYYGYYGPGWTGYSTTYFPAQFLRLEFDANGRLKAWKKYSK